MLSPFFSFMNFYMYNIHINLIKVTLNYNFVMHTLIGGFFMLYLLFFIIVYRVKKMNRSLSLKTFQTVYLNMYDIIWGSIGNNGIVCVSFLFFFWMFLFYFNLLGLFPFAFTIGSHFSITICFSLIAWIGSLILVLESEGPNFFEHFFIDSINFHLAIFISLIELISYIFRAVSLALRLFANLVAGHVLLHLTGALVISSSEWTSPINFLYVIQTFLLLCVFTFLLSFELIISFVQSYVFLLLTCIYMQDTFNNYLKNMYYFSRKKIVSEVYMLVKEDYSQKRAFFNENVLSYSYLKYNIVFSHYNKFEKELTHSLNRIFFFAVETAKKSIHAENNKLI